MTLEDWLLDSDPSIRWQVMHDLLDAPADEVADERARVATEGWGARLLALQASEGWWGGGAYMPTFTSTHFTLQLVREMGLEPGSQEARRAVALVRENVRLEYDELPYFGGEVEPCINGSIVAIGTYFEQDMWPVVARLLGEQMEDGGWNCRQEVGSTRGSFDTTINVLEGLLEFERAAGPRPEVTDARQGGEEYLLQRQMFRRKSTGEVVDPRYLVLAFPTWFFYDVLRGLDHLRRAGVEPDARAEEAIAAIRAKQDADGRWPLERRATYAVGELWSFEGEVHFPIDAGVGEPSRWNTLRAMRVLRWWDGFEPVAD
jgi:hypothetical protein